MMTSSFLSPQIPLFSPLLSDPCSSPHLIFKHNCTRHAPPITCYRYNITPNYSKNLFFASSMSIGNDATTRVSSASSSSSFSGGTGEEIAQEIESASEDDDDEEGGEFVVDTDSWSSCLPERWDVLGLGQAMIPRPCYQPEKLQLHGGCQGSSSSDEKDPPVSSVTAVLVLSTFFAVCGLQLYLQRGLHGFTLGDCQWDSELGFKLTWHQFMLLRLHPRISEEDLLQQFS